MCSQKMYTKEITFGVVTPDDGVRFETHRYSYPSGQEYWAQMEFLGKTMGGPVHCLDEEITNPLTKERPFGNLSIYTVGLQGFTNKVPFSFKITAPFSLSSDEAGQIDIFGALFVARRDAKGCLRSVKSSDFRDGATLNPLFQPASKRQLLVAHAVKKQIIKRDYQ
ncbi:hypothetical protein [Terasakiella pusilla]|uniref:hypothetical protein n=1 Tax=Terasakiella pusilla TaxID=64973 RepID=UPI00048E72BD|nr:hypothetical protein [Terasakiella pusilla]